MHMHIVLCMMLVSLGAEQKAILPEGEDSLLEAEEEVPSAVEVAEAEVSVKIKKSTIKVDFFWCHRSSYLQLFLALVTIDTNINQFIKVYHIFN